MVLLRMSGEERFKIVRSVGEECLLEDELLNLLTKKPRPICYDGFEPSGRMHIAQVSLIHLPSSSIRDLIFVLICCLAIKLKIFPCHLAEIL